MIIQIINKYDKNLILKSRRLKYGGMFLILLIDENRKLERLIEKANFSEMGVWERTHMEEWIAERPDILGEDLLTVTTEYDRFDKTSKRLDILAIDNNGKIVIIELKRDVAEAFVDLQAIHYAAYCSTLTLEQVSEIRSEYNNASKEDNESEIINFIKTDFIDFDNQPRIILVANDFKEETLAAVLWLRDSGVDITCIKLEAYKLGKKIVITPDIIIPLPEAKEFMMYREQKTKITSINEFTEMSEFWTKILKRVREINPEIPEKKPYKGNYFPILLGYSNVHFEWLLRKRPIRFMVCLHFEKPKKEDNIKLLNYFKSRKEEITSKLNKEIVFDEKWLKNGTQIYIQRENYNLDNDNIRWGAETMAKFYEVLKPILDEYFSKKHKLNT